MHELGGLGRRGFLGLAAAAAGGTVGCGHAGPAASTPGRAEKSLRGLFPIGQTPFTADDKLDTEGLAAEVAFCNRGGVHGFVWPQIASGWTTMSDDERRLGAETLLAAGKGGQTALVIGVQAVDGNLATVERLAIHAARHGADALISLPPPNVTDEDSLLEYYRQVGRMTPLPLFVQCVGAMSVDLLVRISEFVPTAQYVKDEADVSAGGGPLARIAEIRRRTGDRMKVFSGQGVKTMITEMELGFSGHCPYTGLADVYAQAFDLWHADRRREAFDMFGRIQAFGTVASAVGHPILIARGVFKPGTRSRTPASPSPSAPAAPAQDPNHAIESIRAALRAYLAPYLRA